MRDLVITAIGVPIRFVFVGPHAAQVQAVARHAWSRCVGLPLNPWSDHEARVVRVELLDPGEREVTETFGRANAERRAAPTVSHIARHRVDSLMTALTQETTLLAIEANRGRLVMLHAAVLQRRGGEALAFVAPSGTGKTTLASVLGRTWGYAGDETAAICSDGTVVPYPKPLSVPRPALNLKLETAPDDLGLAVPDAPLHLAGVLLLDRRADAVARLLEVPILEAVVELAGQTSALAELDRPLARLAELWGLPSSGRLRYADAAEAEKVLML